MLRSHTTVAQEDLRCVCVCARVCVWVSGLFALMGLSATLIMVCVALMLYTLRVTLMITVS